MARMVTVVCGPPCGGKSSWVNEHANPDDLVVCLDQLAQQLGSDREHNHDGVFYGRAKRLYRRWCEDVAGARNVTAWIIRCAPEQAARLELARLVDATRTVVLLPDRDVAYRRAVERDSLPGATCRAVTAWYRRYQLCPLDEVIHDEQGRRTCR